MFLVYNMKYRKRPDEDREKKAKNNDCSLVNYAHQCACSAMSLFCEHRELTAVPQAIPTTTATLYVSHTTITVHTHTLAHVRVLRKSSLIYVGISWLASSYATLQK